MRCMGISAWLGVIRDVVLPRGCAGCDAPDAVVCGECRELLDRTVVFDMPGTSIGRGYACAWYGGAVRQGDPGVEGPSRRGVRRAAVRGDGRAGRPVPAGDGERDAYCPGGSGARPHRRRCTGGGRRHTAVLAAAVARACHSRALRIDARVVPLLTMDHVRGRSVQMGGGQRSRRVSGRIAVRRPELCRHAHVIVVDDIVTTGATMRQCVDALRSSGAQVVTCLSVAYTPQPDAATVRDSAARDDTSAA